PGRCSLRSYPVLLRSHAYSTALHFRSHFPADISGLWPAVCCIRLRCGCRLPYRLPPPIALPPESEPSSVRFFDFLSSFFLLHSSCIINCSSCSTKIPPSSTTLRRPQVSRFARCLSFRRSRFEIADRVGDVEI